MALTFDSQKDSPHHHDERLQGICVDHSGQPPCGRKQESWRSPSLEGGGTGKQLQSSGRDCYPTSMSPALSQVGEVWDQEAGPAEPDYKSDSKPAMSWAVGGGGPLPPAYGPWLLLASQMLAHVRVAQWSGPPPSRAWAHTCDGVQCCDGEHEDGGQVEVPAQADVHKESPAYRSIWDGKGILC